MKPISGALVACVLTCVVGGSDAEAAKEKVLYSFCSQQYCADGTYPEAGVIDIKGTLYGTTFDGPGGTCYPATGCGTLFSLDPKTSALKILHTFGYGADGYNPAGLSSARGRLYGVTLGGGVGSFAGGIAYYFDLKAGTEKVLYTFCSQQNCTDGENPFFSMLDINGTLYGTTFGGGDGLAGGTVFSLNPKTGVETVLHSFSSYTDGYESDGDLMYVKGALYGTTFGGGTGSCYNGSTCGTIFSLKLKNDAEKVLYSFQGNGTDGETPRAGLINVKGMFYGTTSAGGNESNSCGTVFSFDPKMGGETVLYSFGAATDGCNPFGSMINIKGTLYGTTMHGGTGSCSGIGCGTVFSFSPKAGAEAVVYSFGGTDGQSPSGDLIDVNGTLYGTTYAGGAHGFGTVFSIVP